MSTDNKSKPLGRKAYGSIGHLPMSRMGSGDHACPAGYAKICCQKPRDKHDRIIVQEKLDGSCCAVAKINGAIIALGRAGWRAESSPYEQHQLFHRWVLDHWQRFHDLLDEGERVVGEWLAQAHGTRYNLRHGPFVPFVERQGRVDFLAKFVRPDKVDGCYLPECSGSAPVWNWRPEHRSNVL